MDHDSDMTDLAARVLGLWEESWRQIAQDPDIARYWTNIFATLVAKGTASGATGSANDDDGEAEPGQNRAATAANAPVDRDARVAELTERVRQLERQVAKLGGPGRGNKRNSTTRPFDADQSDS